MARSGKEDEMRMVGATLMLVCLSSAAWAQIRRSAEVPFMRFKNDVRFKRVVLERRTVPKSQQATELKAVLTESSKYLQVLREKSKDRVVPQAYAESVSEDGEIIASIRVGRRVGPTEWEQIKAVNVDLRVKAEHAEMLPEAAFDSIEVIVRTKKNGQELGNHQVWFVKEAYKDDPLKYQTFDRFSSPSSRHLPPGRYVMWSQATDGSKALGDRTPKEFGDGKARVEVDLAAP